MLASATLAALGCAALVHAGGQAPANPPLRFTADGKFQITQFSDLHFGENYWDDWGPVQDIDTVNKVMNTVLDKEQPQLVVLNGDLITGENAFAWNSTAVFNKIAAPMVARGLTWASTYGNHDSQFNLSRAELIKAEHNYTNARTTNMLPNDETGVTNYYLPVYPSDGSTDVPALILWFFDSRGGFAFNTTDSQGNGVPLPDWVDQRVVDWFTWTQDDLALTYGKTIPSVAFVHIPTDASLRLQAKGVSPHFQPGINDDVPLAQQGQNWCANGTYTRNCYGGQDVPFMRALAATDRLLGVFSGHDHGDTWCYKWESSLLPDYPVQGNGLNLCFGQHSGYGGYGNWVRGGRQILITEAELAAAEAAPEKETMATWIRLETGDVVGSVHLNSTYGSDSYPVTPDIYTS